MVLKENNAFVLRNMENYVCSSNILMTSCRHDNNSTQSCRVQVNTKYTPVPVRCEETVPLVTLQHIVRAPAFRTYVEPKFYRARCFQNELFIAQLFQLPDWERMLPVDDL